MCCYSSRLVFNLLLRYDISQGSVAKNLRCGGTFTDDIRPIANFLLNLRVKKIENRLIFDKVIMHTKIVPFLGQPVD